MPAPVRHTCPDIDKVIDKIRQAMKYADEGKGYSEKGEDQWNCFDGILDELYRIDDTLENLRSSNSSLRDWGEELEKQVLEHEDTIFKLEEELKELQTA